LLNSQLTGFITEIPDSRYDLLTGFLAVRTLWTKRLNTCVTLAIPWLGNTAAKYMQGGDLADDPSHSTLTPTFSATQRPMVEPESPIVLPV
jgi:hypothetical protein